MKRFTVFDDQGNIIREGDDDWHSIDPPRNLNHLPEGTIVYCTKLIKGWYEVVLQGNRHTTDLRPLKPKDMQRIPKQARLWVLIDS